MERSESLARDQRVDELCDRFEQAWTAGKRPRIEQFLSPISLEERPPFLRELVVSEWELRIQAGESPSVEEYLQRFSHYPQSLNEVIKEALLSRKCGSTEKEPSAGEPQASSLKSQSSQVSLDSTHKADGLTPASCFTESQSKPPLSSTPPPRELGRYQMKELLGRGGFGEVWHAEDAKLKQSVAIKLPRSDRPVPEDVWEQILAEARKVTRLEIPGVVRILDVCQVEDRCFIVSEYKAGGTLAERMAANPFSFKEAAEMAWRLAGILQEAHLQDCIHRDVKPANVLLDQRGRPYLSDFGLATSERDLLSESTGMRGTVAYMSPEQARGESHLVDGRSDIFSLGVILYELLTGRLPYLTNEPAKYLEQLLHKPPRAPRSLNEQIPQSLEQICLKCLEKDPARRYATASDLAHDLQEWIDAERLRKLSDSVPMMPVAPSPRWHFPVKLIGGFAIAVMIVVLANAIWSAVAKHSQSPGTNAGNLSHSGEGSANNRLNLSLEKETAFQKLPEEDIEPLKAYDLFQTPPKKIIGQTQPGRGMFFDGRAGTFLLATNSFDFYRLGRIERDSYILRFDVSQNGPWMGRVGVFFGLRDRVLENGTLRPVGQLIYILPNNDRDKRELPMLAIRQPFEIDDGSYRELFNAGDVPASQKIAQPIPSAGRETQIEIRVEHGRLRSVRWGGTELFTLCSVQLNDQFTDDSYSGDFGVMAGHTGGLIFQSAEIRVLNDN